MGGRGGGEVCPRTGPRADESPTLVTNDINYFQNNLAPALFTSKLFPSAKWQISKVNCLKSTKKKNIFVPSPRIS